MKFRESSSDPRDIAKSQIWQMADTDNGSKSFQNYPGYKRITLFRMTAKNYVQHLHFRTNEKENAARIVGFEGLRPKFVKLLAVFHKTT